MASEESCGTDKLTSTLNTYLGKIVEGELVIHLFISYFLLSFTHYPCKRAHGCDTYMVTLDIFFLTDILKHGGDVLKFAGA